jgi:hypothetical protein
MVKRAELYFTLGLRTLYLFIGGVGWGGVGWGGVGRVHRQPQKGKGRLPCCAFAVGCLRPLDTSTGFPPRATCAPAGLVYWLLGTTPLLVGGFTTLLLLAISDHMVVRNPMRKGRQGSSGT